jgi:outer membrane protein assembly factor BamB
MKSISFIIILFSMFSCGYKSSVTSKDVIASIVFVLGDVAVEKSGTSIKASLNSIVEKGAVVKTLKGSQCNILIQPDSYILVKENSSFSIESMVQESNGTSNTDVKLNVGKIAINPGKLLKGSEFKVRTPTAVAAVRGTKFTVSSEEGKGVQISVIEGKVELRPRILQLENPDTPGAIKNAIVSKLNKQSVIIDEKQTGEINSESAEKMARDVSSVIAEYQIAESMPIEKRTLAKEKAIEKLPQVVAAGIPLKKDVISGDSVRDVELLSNKIEENKKLRIHENETSGTINIINPINDADVLVDGKRLGRGSVSLKIAAGVKTKIEIRAKKFVPYVTDIILNVGEEKLLQPELIKTTLLERIEWSDHIGNIKGDIAVADGVIISASSSGTVSAIRGNGIKVWSVSIGCSITSTPAVGISSVYIVGANEMLYSIDLSTGNINWKTKAGGLLTFGSAPCVENDVVVTALSNGLIKGFSKEGGELWVVNIKAGIYSSPTSSGGIVYFGADDQILYSMNVRNGSIIWKGKLDGRVVSSSPVISDNAVIIGTYKGTLSALNIKNGKSLWAFKTKGSIVSTPVVKNGMIYFGSRDKNIYAVNRNNGELIWSHTTGAPISADVSVMGDIMYALSGNVLYAFDLQQKNLKWTFEYPSVATSVQSGEGRVYIGGNAGVTGIRTDLRDIIRQ